MVNKIINNISCQTPIANQDALLADTFAACVSRVALLSFVVVVVVGGGGGDVVVGGDGDGVVVVVVVGGGGVVDGVTKLSFVTVSSQHSKSG